MRGTNNGGFRADRMMNYPINKNQLNSKFVIKNTYGVSDNQQNLQETQSVYISNKTQSLFKEESKELQT